MGRPSAWGGRKRKPIPVSQTPAVRRIAIVGRFGEHRLGEEATRAAVTAMFGRGLHLEFVSFGDAAAWAPGDFDFDAVVVVAGAVGDAEAEAVDAAMDASPADVPWYAFSLGLASGRQGAPSARAFARLESVVARSPRDAAAAGRLSGARNVSAAADACFALVPPARKRWGWGAAPVRIVVCLPSRGEGHGWDLAAVADAVGRAAALSGGEVHLLPFDTSDDPSRSDVPLQASLGALLRAAPSPAPSVVDHSDDLSRARDPAHAMRLFSEAAAVVCGHYHALALSALCRAPAVVLSGDAEVLGLADDVALDPTLVFSSLSGSEELAQAIVRAMEHTRGTPSALVARATEGGTHVKRAVLERHRRMPYLSALEFERSASPRDVQVAHARIVAALPKVAPGRFSDEAAAQAWYVDEDGDGVERWLGGDVAEPVARLICYACTGSLAHPEVGPLVGRLMGEGGSGARAMARPGGGGHGYFHPHQHPQHQHQHPQHQHKHPQHQHQHPQHQHQHPQHQHQHQHQHPQHQHQPHPRPQSRNASGQRQPSAMQEAEAIHAALWAGDEPSLIALPDARLPARAFAALPHHVIVDPESPDLFTGIHRSGWAHALTGLLQFDARFMRTAGPPPSAEGTLVLDTYVDRTFGWGLATLEAVGALPRRSPWAGFVHHTFDERSGPNNCTAMFRTPAFLESLAECTFLVSLTPTHARALESALSVAGASHVRVVVLTHPTETPLPAMRFGVDKLQRNSDRLLVQVGTWLRDTYAIYRLPLDRAAGREANPWALAKASLATPSTATQSRSLPPNVLELLEATLLQLVGGLGPGAGDPPPYGMSSDALDSVSQHVAGMVGALRDGQESVREMSPLDNSQYDELLRQNVVFLSLYDCSAVNTVIECLARNTPIILNRLPALEDALGHRYPGFYNHIAQVPVMLSDASLIERAHKYLAARDKAPLSLSVFAAGMLAALKAA
jgi:hypothetical protein